MNRKLIKTLTLVCFILILIITLEWLYAEYTQKQLLSAVDASAKQTPLEEMPTINLNTKTEENDFLVWGLVAYVIHKPR